MNNYLKPKFIIIASIPVVIVALILSTPLIYGYLFKKNYLAFIDNINNTQRDIKINVIEYHLGWLTSSVKLTISSIDSPNSNGQQISAGIDQKIAHGPYIQDPIQHKMTFALASVQGNLHAPDAIEKGLLGISGDQGVMQINSLVSFQYSASNQISMPVFTISIPTMGNISWQGMSGNVSFHTVDRIKINSFTSNVTSGAFAFNSVSPGMPFQELQISASTLTSNLSIQPNKLMNGDSALVVPSISIKRTDGDIAISQFNAKKLFGMDGSNFYKMSSQFSIAKLDLPAFVIPEISLVDISFSADKLSANGMTQLISEVESINPSSNITNLQIKMFDLIPQLFTPTSTLSANISANSSFGALAIIAKAYWPANLPAPKTLEELSANTSTTINIKIAIPLIAALVEKYADMTPYGMPTETDQQPSSKRVFESNPLNDAVATLLEQGVLELPISLQIMQMGSQDNSVEAFSADIARLQLQPQVAANLIEQFKLQLESRKPAPETVVTQSPADKVKAKIAEWINSGFIIQDKDNYTATITRKGGKLLVNGKVVQ